MSMTIDTLLGDIKYLFREYVWNIYDEGVISSNVNHIDIMIDFYLAFGDGMVNVWTVVLRQSVETYGIKPLCTAYRLLFSRNKKSLNLHY